MRIQTLGIIFEVVGLVGGIIAVVTLGECAMNMLIASAMIILVGWSLHALNAFYIRKAIKVNRESVL